MKLTLLSLGAGVQSTALALMAAEGTLPHLDGAVFADTGWEPRQVYGHLDRLEKVLAAASIPLHRVSAGNLRDDAIDPAHRYASVPYYVRNPDGSDGMGRRQCTSEYKLTPINKKVRELLGAAAPDFRRVPRGHVAEQWIGFSTDEIHRVSDKEDGKRRDVSYSVKRYPLLDLGMDRNACQRWLRSRGWTAVEKSACIGCLSYETEVVTSSGTKPIGSLVGPDGVGKATLLIPRPRSAWAGWREVEVRSFGVQRLYRIQLVRRSESKTVYATAEHRWKVFDRRGCWSPFMTTLHLRLGDVLPVSGAQSVKASGRNNTLVSPIGIAAGFTFGDGSLIAARNGPAFADLFDGKDEPLMPYFPNIPAKHYEAREGTNRGYRRVYGLPRTWKTLPPLDEARGYLLGWLAGYFAADGHVTKAGQAVLSSANRKNLAFVRDLCYVLGVRTSAVRTKEHPGIGGRSATLHEVGVYFRDLPLDFWVMPHHRERVVAATSGSTARRDGWTVVEVSPTDRVEEVFCAVVPGEEMFVLADNLVTGNCPFHGNAQWRRMRDGHPDEWADAVAFDEAIRKGGARGLPLNGEAFLHRSRVPLAEAPIDRTTHRERAGWQSNILDELADRELEEGDSDGCSPYGCRSGQAVA